MDMRRLRALHAVVTTGSVHGAAAEIGYTPSAISQHVAALEQETGMVLLERAGRGVRPTQAALLLSEHAAALIERLKEAEAAVASLRAGELGVLRLASFATAGASLVPPALATVRDILPHLEVDLRVAERDDALPRLRQGELDVAIMEAHDLTAAGSAGDGVTVAPLLDDPYRLILPRGHRLARRRTIDLVELEAESWVDVVCGTGCCRETTEAAFGRAGYSPRRSIEADEYWPAQAFVAAGLGVALVPTLSLGVLHEGVVVRRLKRGSAPVRHVVAATRAAVSDTVPINTMLSALHAAAAAHARAHDEPVQLHPGTGRASPSPVA
jgi:DNA-binding transcriptional LysR family regulator